MSDTNQEIQKTLREMKKRMADFQSRGVVKESYSSNYSLNSKIELGLVVAGLAGAVFLAFSVFWEKRDSKENPGLQTFKNAPRESIPPELLKIMNESK